MGKACHIDMLNFAMDAYSKQHGEQKMLSIVILDRAEP